MPRVIISIHDPSILTAACSELSLGPLVERAVRLDTEWVFGWAMRLPGLRFPVVFNFLTGLVAYHPYDNTFNRYGCLMRFFILRVYVVQARRRWDDCGRASSHDHFTVLMSKAV